MELGSPGRESHDRAVVIRFRASGGALKRATAGHGVGTDHLGTGDIEQEHFACQPVVREISGKRTYSGAVARDYGRPPKPVTRKTEVNHALIGGAVILVNVEVEAAGDKHASIAGDSVKDVAGA